MEILKPFLEIVKESERKFRPVDRKPTDEELKVNTEMNLHLQNERRIFWGRLGGSEAEKDKVIG